MKHAVATASLLLVWPLKGANGQVVGVGADGKNGPPLATSEYCSQVETLRPNLRLSEDTRVRGHVANGAVSRFCDRTQAFHFRDETGDREEGVY